MVEHSTHIPKIEGSKPAIDTGREKMMEKVKRFLNFLNRYISLKRPKIFQFENVYCPKSNNWCYFTPNIFIIEQRKLNTNAGKQQF